MQWCLLVCEDSAAAGGNLGHVCSWLWSLGGNDWFQVPGIFTLGRVRSWQCASSWQCHWVPLLWPSCSGIAQLCCLHYNAQQRYSNITLCQVFWLFLCTFVEYVTLDGVEQLGKLLIIVYDIHSTSEKLRMFLLVNDFSQIFCMQSVN